ncbi:hypothetical protein Hanom_Chr06g00522611 [Helianthus anomalus]
MKICALLNKSLGERALMAVGMSETRTIHTCRCMWRTKLSVWNVIYEDASGKMSVRKLNPNEQNCEECMSSAGLGLIPPYCVSCTGDLHDLGVALESGGKMGKKARSSAGAGSVPTKEILTGSTPTTMSINLEKSRVRELEKKVVSKRSRDESEVLLVPSAKKVAFGKIPTIGKKSHLYRRVCSRFFATRLQGRIYGVCRANVCHAPVWKSKQGDTFNTVFVCQEWFKGALPSAKVAHQRDNGHQSLYHAYLFAQANSVSTSNKIIRERHPMHRE